MDLAKIHLLPRTAMLLCTLLFCGAYITQSSIYWYFASYFMLCFSAQAARPNFIPLSTGRPLVSLVIPCVVSLFCFAVSYEQIEKLYYDHTASSIVRTQLSYNSTWVTNEWAITWNNFWADLGNPFDTHLETFGPSYSSRVFLAAKSHLITYLRGLDPLEFEEYRADYTDWYPLETVFPIIHLLTLLPVYLFCLYRCTPSEYVKRIEMPVLVDWCPKYQQLNEFYKSWTRNDKVVLCVPENMSVFVRLFETELNVLERETQCGSPSSWGLVASGEPWFRPRFEKLGCLIPCPTRVLSRVDDVLVYETGSNTVYVKGEETITLPSIRPRPGLYLINGSVFEVEFERVNDCFVAMFCQHVEPGDWTSLRPFEDMLRRHDSTLAAVPEGEHIYFADVLAREEVKLPLKCFAALKTHLAHATCTSSFSDIATFILRMLGGDITQKEANYLATTVSAYLGKTTVSWEDISPTMTYTVKLGERVLDAKMYNSAFLICDPPVSNYCQASNNQSNLAAGVYLRHTKVAKQVPDKNWKVVEGYAHEFIQQVHRVVAPGTVRVWTVDEVRAYLDTPSQRRRMDQLKDDLLHESNAICGMFNKTSDFTPVDSAPRNITPMDDHHLSKLVAYTAPIKEGVLMKFDWYIPGCTPRQVASRVVNFCAHKPFITESDESKFDGSICAELRQAIELAFYSSYFPASSELKILLRNELEFVAKSKGLSHPMEGSRGSGSPLTTDGNTLISAFLDFCALRMDRKSVKDAFSMIGLHMGDDTVSCCTEASVLKIHELVGLTVKVKTLRPGGDDYLSFLGRAYPDPWTSEASMQEPQRVWPKIACVFNPGMIDKSKFIEAWASKLSAYLMTDPDSPILRAYCKSMIRIKDLPATPAAQAWVWSGLDTTGVNNWPRAESDIMRMRFRAIEQKYFSCYLEEFTRMEVAIETAENEADISAAFSTVSHKHLFEVVPSAYAQLANKTVGAADILPIPTDIPMVVPGPRATPQARPASRDRVRRNHDGVRSAGAPAKK